jgi:hypothetical protein
MWFANSVRSPIWLINVCGGEDGVALDLHQNSPILPSVEALEALVSQNGLSSPLFLIGLDVSEREK